MSERNDFNWDLYKGGYKGGSKLVPNLDIIGSDQNNKCFSREPYAQKLFDTFSGQDTKFIKKDLKKGDSVPIVDIIKVYEDKIDVELAGGLTVTVDLSREKKFLLAFGCESSKAFTQFLDTTEQRKHFIETNQLQAYVIESNPVRISIWQGYLMSMREELMEQIEKPTKAYTAKVISANKGGFFVEVQGLEAFMPGSLAAPNKINDFQSYIGREIPVMIEDYLKDMNSFVVSHKRYIEYVLPSKLSNIDLNKKYKGEITGASKYGIFVEFEEILTGLLHVSKMSEETKKLFDARFYQPGSELEFYIGEVTKDNRVILTEESPTDRLNRIQNFILNYTDKVVEAEIAAIMNFGVIVAFEEISGLVPLREFKKRKVFFNNFVVKDKLNVVFDQYKDEKLVFKLPGKSE